MITKQAISLFSFGVFVFNASYTYSQATAHAEWANTTPFEHHVFIEDKGQFTKEEKESIDQPILYYNRLGKTQIYFSATSITFRYDSNAN